MVLCFVHVVTARIIRPTLTQKKVHLHLFKSDFMSGYICWTKQGERGVMMEDYEEEEDDDKYHGFKIMKKKRMMTSIMGTTMKENEEEDDDDNMYSVKYF